MGGGCSGQDDFALTNPQQEEGDPTTRGGKERSLEGALYHKATGTWIVPQNDPYTLENFQSAYDNMAAGKSRQDLSKSEGVVEEFLTHHRLAATHYSLKVYPRDEKEQWSLELMEDIKVAYSPFDYVALTDAEAEKLDKKGLQESLEYPDESRYKVTYTDLQGTEGPIPDKTIVMPVLYVVWPCGKPLPAELDYEIMGDLFHPDRSQAGTDKIGTRGTSQSDLSPEAMQILENEAIMQALGKGTLTEENPIIVSPIVRTLSGRLYNYDNFLKKNVPLANLYVRLTLGSSVNVLIKTDSNGYFSFSTRDCPEAGSFSIIFQHPKWKITDPGSTVPLSINYGTISSVWRSGPNISWNIGDSTRPSFEVHRAVSFYFVGVGAANMPVPSSGEAIRIETINGLTTFGSFHYTNSNDIFINIQSDSNDAGTIGLTFAKLGEYVMYDYKGPSNWTGTPEFMRKSWAAFAGWYLGEAYYKFNGWTKPPMTLNNDITGFACQDWDRKYFYINFNYMWHTPLYIDLVDDFNQYNYSPNHYAQDVVTGIPENIARGIIIEAALNTHNWEDCKELLRVRFRDYHYPSQNIGILINTQVYDTWINENPYI